MKVPKKIYLFKNPITEEVDDRWLFNRSCDDDVEYIQTDAFLDKACEFLKDRIEHDSIDYPMATKHLVDDFKTYMEE